MESHRFCDIIDIFITGNQQIGCLFHTDVRTVIMDTQPGKVFNGFVERISGIIKMRFQVCTCDFSVGHLVEILRNPQEPNGPGNGFFHEEDMVYETTLQLEKEAEDKRIWLEFEAVYQNVFVYVNNAFAGKCAYGYSNFYLDVTDFVKIGQANAIKVIVKDGVPSGRWYTGGGIFRDVHLMIAEPTHIAPDGVFVKTESVDDQIAEIAVCTEVVNDDKTMKRIFLSAKLTDEAGKTVAEGNMPITIRGHVTDTYKLRLFVKNPKLWDAEHPNLYHYEVSIWMRHRRLQYRWRDREK